jgi:hypothetical protein
MFICNIFKAIVSNSDLIFICIVFKIIGRTSDCSV